MNSAKAKVAIIGRGLRPGGVLRYIKNLLTELNKNNDFEYYFIHTDIFFLKDIDNIKTIYIPSRSKLWFDYITSFLLLNKMKFDLVLYPKNVIPVSHYLLKCKKINVIHDLGYFEKSFKAYPFIDTLFMRTFMKISCKYSNGTIAVSENTKNDIISKLSISSENVHEIHLAAESTFIDNKELKLLEKIFSEHSIQKPYIFFAGSVNPRKNMKRIINSFISIQDKIPHTFVITGFDNWSIPSDMLNNPKIKVIGFRSEEELVELYNHSDLFIYTSLYEGFGLPILEAQACGCPVITSNITSCPEVAGDGACIVNPYSEKEIAEGILKILLNETCKKKLISKGGENIKRFSWAKNAEQTVKLFHKVINNR